MGTVNIPQYPDNSNSTRYNAPSEEAPVKVEEKAEKIVEGTVVRKKKGGKKTIGDVFNTFNEEQKTAVYAIIGLALEDAKAGNNEEENENGNS